MSSGFSPRASNSQARPISLAVLDALFTAGPIEAITAPTIDFTNKWHYPSKEVSVVGFANGEPMLQAALVPKHSPHLRRLGT